MAAVSANLTAPNLTARGHIMKSAVKSATFLFGTLLAFGSGLAIAPRPALAAHAGAPYTNVDHRNDKGNDTGDSQVDTLNQGQLNQNYWHNAQQPGGVPNPPSYAPQAMPQTAPPVVAR
jgi:hypothetical protein